MKITIVGGGNIGLALASDLSLRTDNEIVLFSGKMIDPSVLLFYDVENAKRQFGLSFQVTSDLRQALQNSDYVFCTYPAFLRRKFIEEAEPYISKQCRLGFFPGYGGAEYCCKRLIEKGATIFGLQRVPYVARQTDKKEVSILSRKKELFVAAIPKKDTLSICKDLQQMIGIASVPLNEYLSVTLVPSNPLLHLTGLYHIFKDYEVGDYYDKHLMFYEEWDDSASKILFDYDDELQSICRKMYPLDLHEVVSLKTHYESNTPEQLTRKLKSIPSLYDVVKVPLIEKNGRYYPDFNSRMFIEDFPFGIAIIKYFAILVELDTPTIDKILKFYKEKTGIYYFDENNLPAGNYYETGSPGIYGLDTIEKIIEFYNK